MIDFPDIKSLCIRNSSKILMLVVDGLGGLPKPDSGMSELESAFTPNLDLLAKRSSGGLTIPVAQGITPGSGPGHMALFGYDPVKYLMGRGVLEALGIGINLMENDVAARGNLCTVDGNGLILDRRAGRIGTKDSEPLFDELNKIKIPGVELFVYPVRDHRFVLVLRGEGLEPQVTETDPQVLGVPPLESESLASGSNKTASVARTFALEARRVLQDRDFANMVLMRGFSKRPNLPQMDEIYGMRCAAVAAYPMYRGLAELIGMEVLKTGSSFDDQLDTLEAAFKHYEFFFLHYKAADAAGEDGDFEGKVAALEELDSRIPRILDLNPNTLVIGGDHSTPAIMGAHSWHPVPLLVHSSITAGDGVAGFSERACGLGSIGMVSATDLMMIAMANAGKLQKFGP